MEKGVPIRSLTRGIAVLQALNRGAPLSMTEISRTSRVPYPTACRIVQTLLHEGLVEQEPARKRYRPTVAVQTLAHGFREHGNLVATARPHLVELTGRVGWPVSLSTRVGDRMIIRDSTHALTTLTFNDYAPGYSLPILECAAGLVWLAHLPAEERAIIVASLRQSATGGSKPVLDLIEHEGLARTIVERGYASRDHVGFTRNPGKTSAMAVPVFEKGRLTGALTLAFFSSALTLAAAEKSLLPALVQTAGAIEQELAA